MINQEFIFPDEFSSEVQSFLMANEETRREIASDIVAWYHNLHAYCSSLFYKANKPGSGFVLLTQPDFTVSYLETKPLFDGSEETTEFFTVDTYKNHTLFETRSVPTSYLKNLDLEQHSNSSDFFPEQQAVDPERLDYVPEIVP